MREESDYFHDQSSGSNNNKNHKKYRRDKPWDNENINHWQVDNWTEDDDQRIKSFAEESSFATLFPKYREKYLREVWPLVTRSLEVKYALYTYVIDV